MLETIREYALEQLEAAGELRDRAIEQHGPWFAELAEDLDAEAETGDQSASVARLVDDYPNLRGDRARPRAERRRAAAATGDGALVVLVDARLRGRGTAGARGRPRALRPPAGQGAARPVSLRVFSGNSDGLLDDVQEVLRAAEELGDPLTLTQAWNLLGRVEGTILGSLARAEEAWQQALEHAERGNLPTERAEIIGWLMMAANFGPLPVEEGIARCRRFHDEAVDDPFVRGNACVELGALRAMRGDFPLGARARLGRPEK